MFAAAFLCFLCQGPPGLLCRPNEVRVRFDDVDRFCRAYELGKSGDLAQALDEGYIKPGSLGVRAFLPNRIENAKALAETVARNPARYEGLGQKLDAVRIQVPRMAAAFETLKRLYPKAQLPECYFVVGRLNTGGISTASGLVLALEHGATDPAGIVPLVAHELVHFQQKGSPNTLLDRSIHEGAADFVGELICGRLTPHAQTTMNLARQREAEFWSEFQKDLEGSKNQGRWLYNAGQGTKAWPSDLGYFIGYEICRTYYERSLDRTRALSEILETTDYAALFQKSGYAERLKRGQLAGP